MAPLVEGTQLLHLVVSPPWLVGGLPPSCFLEGGSPPSLPSWLGGLSFLVGWWPPSLSLVGGASLLGWFWSPPPSSRFGVLPSDFWCDGVPSLLGWWSPSLLSVKKSHPSLPSWFGRSPFPFVVGRSPLPFWLSLPSPLFRDSSPRSLPPLAVPPLVVWPSPLPYRWRGSRVVVGRKEEGALLPSPFHVGWSSPPFLDSLIWVGRSPLPSCLRSPPSLSPSWLGRLPSFVFLSSPLPAFLVRRSPLPWWLGGPLQKKKKKTKEKKRKRKQEKHKIKTLKTKKENKEKTNEKKKEEKEELLLN